MSKLTSIAAVTVASFVFTTGASAQTAPFDYDFNFAPLANAPQVFISDMNLFSVFGQAMPQHQAGFGDAIRRCYSVDVTQSGRNESGLYETTWLTITQGFGALNQNQGVDLGFMSVQSATDSDLGGDACMSPWSSSVGNTGGHKISAVALPGLQAATAGAPAPAIWTSAFQWISSGSGFTGVSGQNTIGVGPSGNPLLANVIFEVQGPNNAAVGDQQYYMLTLDEQTGLGAASAVTGRGTGGVTNGNSNWGFNVFGGTADTTAAVAHTRIFGTDPGSGVFTGFTPFWGNSIGSGEANLHVAFSTPFLWAENNGSIGAGGPDWNVASGPPSLVNVWLKDIKSGGEINDDIDWKIGGGGINGAAFDPSIIVSFGYFLWSETPAASMQQLPMSWDELGGLAPPKAGSYVLTAVTTREGVQSMPISNDALTFTMLGMPGLSLGTNFTRANSVNFDTLATTAAIREGMFDPVVSGISKLTQFGGAPFPVSPAADPTLGGKNIGLGAVSVQIRTDPVLGARADLAEIASALTLTLQ